MAKTASDLRVPCGELVEFGGVVGDNVRTTENGPGRGVGTSGRGLIDATKERQL